MVTRGGSLDPSAFPDEEFELYSIPAHDRGGPEIALGSAIGSSKQIVQPGDVMISKIIPHIRRARIVASFDGRRQIASSEWIVFRGQSFHPRYLRHFLLSEEFHGQFMSTVAGVGGSLVRARPAQVRAIALPLPSIAEQRRIAAILDRADAIRIKRRQRLAHLETLTQSVFNDSFGADGPTTTLGEVATFHSGGTPSKRRRDFWGGELPWFSAKDLKANDLWDSQDHIASKVTKETSLRALPPDTITLVVRGMILAHTIPVTTLRVRATINQDLKAVLPKPDQDVDVDFLAEAIRARQGWILARVSTAAHGTKKLEAAVLSSVPIPIVGWARQRAFAKQAAQIRAERARVQHALAADEELFASLQSRAFRGEL